MVNHRHRQARAGLLWDAIKRLLADDQGRREASVLAAAASLMTVLNVELSATASEAQAFFVCDSSRFVSLGLVVTPINHPEPTERLPRQMLFGADIIVQVMRGEITLIKHRWHRGDGVYTSVRDAVGRGVKVTTDLRTRHEL